MCPYSMRNEAQHHDARTGEQVTIETNPWHPTLAIFQGTTPGGEAEFACVKDGTPLVVNGRELTNNQKIDEAVTVEVMVYHHEGSNDWVIIGNDETPHPLVLFKGWKFTVGSPVIQQARTTTVPAAATHRTTPAYQSR